VLPVPVPAFSAASLLPGILPGFQLPPAFSACLLVWLLPVSAAAAGPLFASRLPGRPAFSAASLLPGILPGFQLPPGLCCQGRASFSAAGMLPGFQLPPIRSRRRIYFYKFNLFLCCRGIFFFWDPVKLPGIKALYQTIYNYNIYKTIQDHFSSCLFLLPGQKIPLVIFLLLGTPYFQGFRGYRQNIFEFFSKKGLTNNTQCCIV